MAIRGTVRRPSLRAVGNVALTILLGSCALLYPGEGSVTLSGAGTEQTVPVVSGARAATDRGAAGQGGAGCPASLPTGWVAQENQRHGDRLELPSSRDGAPSVAEAGDVVGFADRSSAVCGDRVAVRLSGPPAPVELTAYRIGAYGGVGARQVWRSAPLRVQRQAVPSGTAYPHLVEPQWPPSISVPVDGDWTPGFYLLVPVIAAGTVGAGRPAGPAIPLVVRNDTGTEPILFTASTLTWAAYDDWGGWSLYHGPAGSSDVAEANRARIITLRRPLVGAGYQQMRYMDLTVVRQLEQLGLDVAYATDEDVDANPGLFAHHAELVSGGHAEYWTRRMYDGLLAAAGNGVNLAFLGANNLWWQARLESSPRSPRPDRMVVYRAAGDDPAARHDPSAATVLWGPAPLRRDPAAVLGESYAAIGVRGGLQILDAPAWLLAGTGLTTGSVLPGSVGNEASGYNRRGHNPPTTQVVAAGVLRGDHGPVVVSADYSTLPSGAAVFAAGSTDWACIPAGECFDTVPPAQTATAVGLLTRNVLIALAHPRAGLTHPAVPVVPFVAAQLMPRLAPAAIGTYGEPTQEGEAD